MSNYTKYLQNEIVNIKLEMDTYAGDKDILPSVVLQLNEFEDSLRDSIEADKLNVAADEAAAAGNIELMIELSLAARSLI